jgi:triacylglycerol lipase
MVMGMIKSCAAVVVTLTFVQGAAALPGPPLRTDPVLLASAVTCAGPDLRTAAKSPVLLIHGTFVTDEPWRGGAYEALQAAGYPTCLAHVANRELGDVQGSVEYVVAAIREVARRADRPIAVIGHSQGAFLPAMALRYWPDLAGDVQDFVGLAGVYDNGTTLADKLCAVPCAAVGRQLRPGSAILTALHHRHVYPGPDYTAVSTDTDEVVTPQPHAGLLDGARQIAVQDICPGRYAEHGGMTTDAVAIALARDAIDHPGPADPARIDHAVCSQTTISGTSPTKNADDAVEIAPGLAGFYAQAVPSEPPVRCVLDPACPKGRLVPGLQARLAHRSERGWPWTISTRGALRLPPGAMDLCGGEVRVTITRGRTILSHRHVTMSPGCVFSASVRLGRTARTAATVTGRLRIGVRYRGDAELKPMSAPELTFVARS